jgi:hypothetical protein
VNRIKRAAAALGIRFPQNVRDELVKLAALLIALMAIAYPSIADAGTLSSASVALSDPRPSATSVNYTFTGSTVTSTTIKCVKAVFSTTATSDIAPSGWSGASGSITAASSTLINSSASGWSLATSDGTSSVGQKNIWQYTNAAGITPSTLTGATFVMAGITNSSVADTAYWLHLYTFNDAACVANPVDNATVEFINTNGSTLSLTVDNTLSFTVNPLLTTDTCSDGSTHPNANSTATTIPFGTIVAGTVYQVCQDLQAASNSTNGYTIYLRYDHAPQNALSQTITDWSGSNASPTGPLTTVNSQGAYGYTTDDNTLGTGTAGRFTTGSKYAAATTSNAEVGYEAAGVTLTHYKVTHSVKITATTQPGTYTNTIIYTCTPVY